MGQTMSIDGVSSDNPRLTPLPAERWGDDVLAALELGRGALLAAPLREALDARDAELLAEILPSAITIMLRHPALAGPFLAYSGVFLSNPALPARWRELMVLRVAWRTGSTYEWVQHVRMSPRFDITTDELEAIAKGADAGTWSPFEADLLSATDQLIDNYCIEDATWARLAQQLDEPQLIELLFVVANYVGQAMAYNTFRLQLDAGLAAVEAPVMPPQRG
jgi:4-carboxymuconolactone decarboxylase